jgi:hypothetical protein
MTVDKPIAQQIQAKLCKIISDDRNCLYYYIGIWSLTLREEHRLGVFENRVLRRIFGPKKGDRRMEKIA